MATRRVKRERTLGQLCGVGPATLKDLERLGVRSVAQLARRSPRRMYERLCVLTACRQDPCVLDVFEAAVAQAKNPRLAAEKREWWWWSRRRAGGARTGGGRG